MKVLQLFSSSFCTIFRFSLCGVGGMALSTSSLTEGLSLHSWTEGWLVQTSGWLRTLCSPEVRKRITFNLTHWLRAWACTPGLKQKEPLGFCRKGGLEEGGTDIRTEGGRHWNSDWRREALAKMGLKFPIFGSQGDRVSLPEGWLVQTDNHSPANNPQALGDQMIPLLSA